MATMRAVEADAIRRPMVLWDWDLQGDILPISVLLHDVPPQSWGFSGKPLSFEQLQSPPAGAKPL